MQPNITKIVSCGTRPCGSQMTERTVKRAVEMTERAVHTLRQGRATGQITVDNSQSAKNLGLTIDNTLLFSANVKAAPALTAHVGVVTQTCGRS